MEMPAEYRVAFDDSGVAIGSLLADARAIDQGDTQTAFGEMQGDRCADNAGAGGPSRRYTCHA